MKKLNTSQGIKDFAIALQKFLSSNELEVKHSLMLEGIAKSMDVKDWNTLSALLSNQNKNITFNHTISIHNNNGSYDLAFSSENNLLKIKTVYNANTECVFSVDFNLLSKITQSLKEYQYVYSSYNSNLSNDFKGGLEALEAKLVKNSDNKKSFTYNDTKVKFTENGFFLEFSNSNSSIVITQITNIEFLNELVNFFDRVLKDFKLITLTQENKFIIPNREGPINILEEKKTLPLTEELINSMCMRYDHSFGLWESTKMQPLKSKMKELYQLYKNGLSDEEINEITEIYIETVRQLREEVNGTGFYRPISKNIINLKGK